MNEHPSYEQLNDWLDEELSEPEAARIEAHVASCDECSSAIARLRSLLASSRALPRTMPVPADVWDNIQTRVHRRSALWQYRYQLAAAAVLIVALTATLTLALTQRPSPAVAVQEAPPSDIQLAVNKAEADYTEPLRALEALLEARRSTLDTATINLLDRHIALIDDAIRSAKTALAENPNNEQLPHLITGAYERKITMLKRALRSRDI
jgi:hypothetical protein